MDKAYRLYCQIATVVFAMNTIYPVTTKLVEGRLAEDWLHSVLHLGSALVAAYAAWYAPTISAAKAFTWGIGLLYFALGLLGWLTPGLLLHTPFAIPLDAAANVFHLLLSVPALVIAALDIRMALQSRRSPGGRLAARASSRR